MIRSIPRAIAQPIVVECFLEVRYYIVALLFACVALSEPVSAQTLFRWPDARVDVTKYSYLENCYAAVKRVSDSLNVDEQVLSDTVEQTNGKTARPLASAVIEIADRCLSRYDVSQIPLTEAFLAQELYLMAGRDRDAALIIQRRLAAVPVMDTVARAHVMDSIVRRYLRATPIRLGLGQSFTDSIMALGATVPITLRSGINLAVFFAARSNYDWPVMQASGNSFLQIMSGRTDEDRMHPAAPLMNSYAAGVSRTLFQAELLDSLKSSTAAFVNLQNRMYTAVTKESSYDRTIGEPVATLNGDFWFPDSAKKESYPRRGRTTLMYFDQAAHTSTSDYQVRHAILRRIGKAFPEIDIVVVANTEGYFGNIEPPTPEEEAVHIDTLLTKFFNLPGVLTVTSRPFIPLLAPDRRKITQPTENVTSYPGRPSCPVNCFYLTDPDRRLLWYSRITSVDEEPELKAMLSALRARGAKQE